MKVAAAVALLSVSTAFAQDGDVADLKATIETLQKKVAQQDRRIAELESAGTPDKQARREAILEVLKEMNLENGGPQDFRVYWKDGFRLDSNDGRFKMRFGGRFMADAGWISGNGIEKATGTDLEDGVEFRRIRLYVQGTLGENLGFKWQMDWADGEAKLKDLYLDFRKVPWVGTVRVGHFKEPFSLEELTSSKYITFAERSLANAMAPSRNLGIMATNAFCDDRATYAVGLFRGIGDTGDSGNLSDPGYNLTARVTALPVYADGGRQLLHVGAAYSLRTPHDNDPVRIEARPEAHFTEKFIGVEFPAGQVDNICLFGAEVAWVMGPFSLQGEWIDAHVNATSAGEYDDPSFCGFYVQGSYFLTGEHRPYKKSAGAFDRVKPLKNFREDGGWGAWEVAARYSRLDLDENVSPGYDDGDPRVLLDQGTLQDVTVGLNWYLNPNVRMMWNYIRTCTDSVTSSDAADIFLWRVQVDF